MSLKINARIVTYMYVNKLSRACFGNIREMNETRV